MKEEIYKILSNFFVPLSLWIFNETLMSHMPGATMNSFSMVVSEQNGQVCDINKCAHTASCMAHLRHS